MRIDPRDFIGGAIMALAGAGFLLASLNGLEIGTAFRMGPGYFPMLLGGLLAAIGLILILGSLRAQPAGAEPSAPFPWRSVIFICLGPLAFALTVRGAGLVPSLILSSGLAALASPEITPRRLVMTVAGITAFCVLLFHYGLSLPIQLIGPWLGGA